MVSPKTEPLYSTAFLHTRVGIGLEITDPGQVLYKETKISAVVEHEVTLKCGLTLPDIYIWSFTKPGTEMIRAVVYNFGKGPKLQLLAQDLNFITNSSSLFTTKLLVDAEGLYTCQALYDSADGAKLYYYYVHLRVLVPMSKPSIVLSDSSAVEGSVYLMQCGLQNGTEPIQYTWEQVTQSGQVTLFSENNSSLNTINPLTRNHTGWYRCLARNEVNQQISDRIWLDVMYGPDLPQIDVTAYSVTDRGYAALKNGTISLMCQASSKPPSQYVWFYNNSEISNGPQLNISRILRGHAGNYTCLAKNTFLNTSAQKTINLTVYYPPDSVPFCSIFQANNYTDLALFCSWDGGNPPPTLSWSPNASEDNTRGMANVTRIQPGPDTANNSVFICHGSHVALNVTQSCSARTWLPDGEPKCSANSSLNNEYLMLSCSWEGGFPQALLWWASSTGDIQGTPEESSSLLVLRSSVAYYGKSFVCHAKHPLTKESKKCVVKLEKPVLITQQSLVSVFEGNDAQLTCTLSKTYPPARNITWSNNFKQNAEEKPKKYIVQQAAGWSSLTVLETDSMVDSGQYWCSASNAMGRAEISVLLLVMRYPMPPNVTISKLIYTGRQRTDVNLEWQMQAVGDQTGFIIERQILPDPVLRNDPAPIWQKVGANLEPSTHSYQITNLDPNRMYVFRVTALNRRTVGNPSDNKSPVCAPVSKPYIRLSDPSPAEGTSVWMGCGITDGTDPIHYTWEQESGSGLVTILAESDNSLINITSVTRNHTGWYRCLAKNEVSQQRSDRIWLDVIYGPDSPRIEVTPHLVTDEGYSALEKETVTLQCQAPSNPSSQYIWFYNNSQIYTGPQLTLTRILRKDLGIYACLAQNTNLNTRSKNSITLTVYYAPDGSPSCSILPVNNYTDLELSCIWVGGYPSATLNWSPNVKGNISQGIRLPHGEPQCLAYATRNEYLMLSCSWEGGSPRALLWWASGSGNIQGTSEENSNILVLRSSVTYSGKAFVCHAKHPLAKETKQCVLRLEAPVLMTQRSVVSVYEGNDVQLTCILSKNYPAVTEITWYNNMKQKVGDTPQKYVLQQAAAWLNLTVRETDSMVDSGQYWCSAANAVGGAEIPILLMVMKYPIPPNVTISKILYISHQRTDVIIEWQIKTDMNLTGFFIERQRLPGSAGQSEDVLLWQRVVSDLEPSTRSYQITSLDPAGKYVFRVTAVNHRTTGYPSQVKSPANPPFKAYPAVIGAAIGGMLLATLATVLLFVYLLRNRNTNPRLHDMIFGRQNSRSRENINFPEDEVVGGEQEAHKTETNTGLEISDPGQVVYKDTKISAVVEQEVVLECGLSLPDIYIWSFTKPGTETIRALLYDFGKGPKLQQLAKDLGDLKIISDSASLSMKELPTAAEGLYTCQALYDSADGAKLYYYYVYLRVLGKRHARL
ncbi:V-set and immunoglobulin domain-containing protein 10-like 2 [Trichomycterus rosablanca]|uniref:V-set and immunoglobulin domain-containing protein 10-like 2 n=1 Tax=Trichomycterus rosablanca TaxID=2290929 RepID=UPI002F353C86